MAKNTDKFIKVLVAPATELAQPIDQDSTTINISNIEGWESDTAVIAAIDRVDSEGNLTEKKKEIVIGTIGANGLENVIRGVGGIRQNHGAGAVIETTIAGSEQWNRMVDTLISSLGQNGKLKEQAFEKDSEDGYIPVVPGGAIKDNSINPNKVDRSKTGYVRYALQDKATYSASSNPIPITNAQVERNNDFCTIDSRGDITITKSAVYDLSILVGRTAPAGADTTYQGGIYNRTAGGRIVIMEETLNNGNSAYRQRSGIEYLETGTVINAVMTAAMSNMDTCVVRISPRV